MNLESQIRKALEENFNRLDSEFAIIALVAADTAREFYDDEIEKAWMYDQVNK